MAVVILLLLPFPAPGLAQSGADNMLWGGQESNVQAATGLGNTDIRVVIARVIQIFLGFLGIIAVFLILYAGWLWMSSQGNEQSIEKAKKTLIAAFVGLVIILMSFGIVTFILNRMAGIIGSGSIPGGTPSGLNSGVGALGACTIETVYPVPNQTDVPRNTSIVVTFREPVDPATVISGGQIIDDGRVLLYRSGDDPTEPNNWITDVSASVSTDNRIYVFTPNEYLGSPSEFIWYTARLSNDIRMMDGSGVFDTCSNDFFEWNFEVNTSIDLTPPQVATVFPAPDNARDTVTGTPAVRASGAVTVANPPSEYAAAAYGGINPIASPAADVAMDPGSNVSGTLTVTILPDGITATLNNGATLLGSAPTSDGRVSFGGYLTLSLVNYPTDYFQAGNSWDITGVSPEQQADNLRVGGTIYVFGVDIATDPSVNAAAANIAAALASNGDVIIDPPYAGGNTINLRAADFGVAGNSVELSTNDPIALVVTAMSGGVDGDETVTVNNRRDEPRNAVIQANFNEPVNPLNLSGAAVDLAGVIAVKCLNGPDCIAANPYTFNCGGDLCLSGSFIVSNIYRTVEFISDNQCAVNSCGEPIYCLPAESEIRVEIAAAGLEGCVSCGTKSPYNDCGPTGHCYDADAGINHPMAASPITGVVDMAMNSLDGDRSGGAVGPISFFNENSTSLPPPAPPAPGGADSFMWSFFVTDQIDLTPPTITLTIPAHNGTDFPLNDPLLVDFDKVMLSSSLNSGSVTIFNGTDYVVHQRMNLWSMSNRAVGYWISKIDYDDAPAGGDGELDWTQGLINHTLLPDANSFRAQAGSGVKCIYQNCFMPSSSAMCVGTPSCCGLVPTAADTCP